MWTGPTPREVLAAQVEHRDGFPVPWRFWWEGDVDLRLDRHYGSPAWRDRLVPYLVTTLAVDTLQERPVDTTHAVDAFGSLWRMDRRPWHLERPALPERSLRGFAFPETRRFLDPLHASLEGADQVLRGSPDSYHVVSMGWGLFEQTWRMRGFENALMDAVEAPDFFVELVGRVAELYRELVRACAHHAADAIFFGDDWGDQRGVILGPARGRELVKPYWKSIWDEVHAQGKRVITHSCGSVVDLMDDLTQMGLDVLESVQPEARGMDPYELKRRWGKGITFFGCLGTQGLVPFGRPEEIRAEIRRLRAQMGRGGGFILSTAKGLQPETPTANAAAVLEGFLET